MKRSKLKVVPTGRATCLGCLTIAKQGTTFQVCQRCKLVHYCSKKCQKDHWKIHKPICTDFMECSQGGSAVHVLLKKHRNFVCQLARVFFTWPRFMATAQPGQILVFHLQRSQDPDHAWKLHMIAFESPVKESVPEFTCFEENTSGYAIHYLYFSYEESQLKLAIPENTWKLDAPDVHNWDLMFNQYTACENTRQIYMAILFGAIFGFPCVVDYPLCEISVEQTHQIQSESQQML